MFLLNVDIWNDDMITCKVNIILFRQMMVVTKELASVCFVLRVVIGAKSPNIDLDSSLDKVYRAFISLDKDGNVVLLKIFHTDFLILYLS